MLWQQSCIIREIPGSRRLSVQWDAGCSPPAPVTQGRHWSPPTASSFPATYSPCRAEFNCSPLVSCKTREKIPLFPVHALNKHSVTIHSLLAFYYPPPPPLPPAFNLALARSVSPLLCLFSSVAYPSLALLSLSRSWCAGNFPKTYWAHKKDTERWKLEDPTLFTGFLSRKPPSYS